ncbi:MAG: NADH:ubiquinone reductase (Na(+)-transporting) subunit F, partial [Bacteroidetes bacterium]|nr:NADH:ubiquinone reductase (Na(+)-transporting) subunit F [Bacteroidota bacterium]
MILAEINPAIIITSAIVLAVIILLLVLMLQVAAKRLVNQGSVKITINGEKEVEVAAGTTLLSTLSEQA